MIALGYMSISSTDTTNLLLRDYQNFRAAQCRCFHPNHCVRKRSSCHVDESLIDCTKGYHKNAWSNLLDYNLKVNSFLRKADTNQTQKI